MKSFFMSAQSGAFVLFGAIASSVAYGLVLSSNLTGKRVYCYNYYNSLFTKRMPHPATLPILVHSFPHLSEMFSYIVENLITRDF